MNTELNIATFKKDQTPTIYLGIVRALLKNNPVKKIEILRKLGVNINEVNVKGYYSEYFSRLNKAKVIKYDAVHMAWVQGERYQEYLNQIFKELLSNEDFIKQFGNFLVKFDSNSINFIMQMI